MGIGEAEMKLLVCARSCAGLPLIAAISAIPALIDLPVAVIPNRHTLRSPPAGRRGVG